MDDDFGYDEYGQDEDALQAWEDEQVFQDHEGWDDEPDSSVDLFGIDGMGPDGE